MIRRALKSDIILTYEKIKINKAVLKDRIIQKGFKKYVLFERF